MPCFYPLKGYRSRTVGPSGKRSIVFNSKLGLLDQKIEVPCGRCIGCRLERSRQWAIRCIHEASLHEKNCFITLTYNEENDTSFGSLVKRDFQLFMKKLRKKYGKIRYFHCGEYGEKLGRPHYHALLFGFDFPDRRSHLVSGSLVESSDSLNEIWGKGFCTLGDVTFESAAYVARYIVKKVTGDKAIDHYNSVDFDTGEITSEKYPEYVTMSRRPGIASGWFDKYADEIYSTDSVVIRGLEMKPPKFYDAKAAALDEALMRQIKHYRKENIKNDDVEQRLITREKIINIKNKGQKRSYEQD